ncbi:MAG TPA: DNA-3-methyladenine glycosylase [Methanoregulaceae archaeon]|nr:MAG: DNA-3-methyladenine glycosylase 2 family protein [Methanolinea sp.]HON80694.1 DNA-3-methyladenine glycosylase [Methanoregulaceae archaeon]HPD09428.1 DNA-3-methyladenine glycosylase [Methanoregulaceae archaeon]HRT14779.1 DNA-3-methyladenine glycosylase [Methanoregulaceae archaeon]HRU30352.1 DNA-3-methyladenine glycosylase [Methanoregulaceae archaeon]
MGATAVILNPVPPYDFTLSTFVFSSGDPQIRKAENGRFWQVIRVGENLVLAEVTAEGSTGNPTLKVRLTAEDVLTPGEQEQALTTISRILNLDDYLTPFYQAVRNDPPMLELTKHLRGLKPSTTPTVFEALVDSIIEQQISLAVARTLEVRLTKMFGDSLVVDGQTYYAFPAPERIASATPGQFRSCGLSSMKGDYIRNVAERTVQGEPDLERLRNIRDSEEIITELVKLKGVGRWTAELAILRGMHRLDAFPADDLGLRRSIAQRYQRGGKISAEEARKIADQWGEWKGLAAYYLLIADQMSTLTRRKRNSKEGFSQGF